MNLASNCRLVEATGYDRDHQPTGYAIARGATIRVKARRFRVVGRKILQLADEWLVKVPLVEYRPVFDPEDRVKLRDWAMVEPHINLVHPWYKVEKKLIRVRSLCDIEEADWKELVTFCDRLCLQAGESFTLTREGIKLSDRLLWRP